MGSWNPPGNVDYSDLQILLVGPRRTGKSSAGNTLLGRGRVFETRGGGASTAASAFTSGHHMTVVDAQGWGSSEEFVPQEEKIELLRALSLCGPGGPHIVLLVIPLLDFTEPERRAVEKRMEILTSAVWRHTMVLFTFGDLLRARGKSVQEHIQSGGSALRWLMEKCRYRYHVVDNKTAITGKKETLKQEVNGGVRKQGKTWWRKDDKGTGKKNTGGVAGGKKEAEQKQVRELLSKVEDMLQENGGWHFCLHMYQRMEEEWSCREQELKARLEAETGVGCVRRNQEMEMKMEPEQEQRLEVTEEEQGGSLSKERKNKGECVERKMNREEDEGERVKVELRRQSSEEDGWDTGSDSGVEREEEGRVMKEGEMEESSEVNTGTMAPCRPHGRQKVAFSPIRGLA